MKKHYFGNENGSVLLLVPVLLMVLGLFMVGTIKKAETKSFYGEVKTQDKMERIQKALAIHANRYYRIPCPADPNVPPATAAFGTEKIQDDCDGMNAAKTASDQPQEQVGIVPFRELGLTEFDVRDVWGNYFSYSASPAYTKTPVVGGRIPAWQYTDNIGPVGEPARLPVAYSTNPTDNETVIDTSGLATINMDLTPGNPPTAQEISATFVHKYCRQADSWIQPPDANLATPTKHRDDTGGQHELDMTLTIGINSYPATFRRSLNKNNYKAQFCCATDASTYEMDIFDASEPATIAFLRNGNAFTSAGPLSFTPSDPAVDDLTFSGGGVKGSWLSALVESRAALPLRLNYGDKEVGIKGGLSLGTAWNPVDVDGDGNATDIVGKMYGDNTLFIDIGDDDRKSATLVLGDLGGTYDPTANLTYSVELYDITTGMTVTNLAYSSANNHADDYPDFNDMTKANYNQDLFHATRILGDSSMIGGVGKYEINVADFKEQIEAQNLDVGNIVLKKIHLHTGATSSPISTQLVGMELAKTTAASTDIVVENESGTRFIPARDESGYRPGDEATPDDVTSGFEAPAYTLISHGENGSGAFIVGPGGGQIAFADAGDKERENANHGNRVFTNQRRVIAGGADHFDDIVLWDSQMSLYNVLPNATCETAQADVSSP